MTVDQSVRIAYFIDPRFPGGTSAAVAQELAITSRMGRVSLHATDAGMFKGRKVARRLEQVLEQLNLAITWDDACIHADVVVIHNPSFLKFHPNLPVKIVARHLIVVAHENFLRPGGIEAFDVSHCLNLIDRSSLALKKSIAPISRHNRATIMDWMDLHPRHGWSVLEKDWFNICDFTMSPPSERPTDRRGRHSRPGFEKFPPIADMDACFPPSAGANIILGADAFLDEELHRPHWEMRAFASYSLGDYFEKIDFMVYFTAPTYRESFGRVLVEAMAAGKVVITDNETAASFDGAAIAATPREVDQIIARMIDQPRIYRDQVLAAQTELRNYSGDRFRARLDDVLNEKTGAGA